MNEYTQDIKIICQNHVMKGTLKAAEGHPWRNWKIRVVAVDNNRERKGKLSYLLDHVEYMLHPTFENPRRVFIKEPYLLQEKGWGEFDMRVVLYFKSNLAEPENIFFDLHFREATYTIPHKIHFQNPPQELIKLLSIELPASDIFQPSITPSSISNSNNNDHFKKRRTSPSISSINQSKKIKTPPSISSPYDSKYPPASPSNHDTDDIFRAIHGYRQINHSSEGGGIVEDVYEENDLDNLNPIHSKLLEDHVRVAWGLPEGLDMLELAKRLSYRTAEQTDEIEALIKQHKKEMEENDDEFVVDLYSLGPDLLNQLWDYTERKKMSSSRTVLSPFSLVQANTAMIEDD